MKKFIFIIANILFISSYAQKESIGIRPELPSNYKDTLVIVTNKDCKIRTTEKIISFTLKDDNWHCKEVNFVYYKQNKKWRKMEKRFFTKKELKNYNNISFNVIKKRNKGCIELQGYLQKPTLYLTMKEENGYTGYEVLPIVWGAGID